MQEKDWRIMSQDSYLQNKTLYLHSFDQWSALWDHEHCAFCSAKFGKTKGDFHEGYSTLDDYYWVCVECYRDFKTMFCWQEFQPDHYPFHDFKEILKKEIGLLQGKEIYSAKRVAHLLQKFTLDFQFTTPIEMVPAIVTLSPNKSCNHKIISKESAAGRAQNVCEALQIIKSYGQKSAERIISENSMLCIELAQSDSNHQQAYKTPH